VAGGTPPDRTFAPETGVCEGRAEAARSDLGFRWSVRYPLVRNFPGEVVSNVPRCVISNCTRDLSARGCDTQGQRVFSWRQRTNIDEPEMQPQRPMVGALEDPVFRSDRFATSQYRVVCHLSSQALLGKRCANFG
jgi:hypothetical protein